MYHYVCSVMAELKLVMAVMVSEQVHRVPTVLAVLQEASRTREVGKKHVHSDKRVEAVWKNVTKRSRLRCNFGCTVVCDSQDSFLC